MPNHAASTGGFVSAGAVGKGKWNVAPRPPSPLAQIRPPCDSTIENSSTSSISLSKINGVAALAEAWLYPQKRSKMINFALAKQRWIIERDDQELKQELGWDTSKVAAGEDFIITPNYPTGSSSGNSNLARGFPAGVPPYREGRARNGQGHRASDRRRRSGGEDGCAVET
jgi:hypothetical protein